MLRTLEAVVDEGGNVRLLEHVELGRPRKALVTILDEPADVVVPDTATLSEAALGRDWDRSEEDNAWSHLQQARSS